MVFQWYLFILIFMVALFANTSGQVHIVNSYGQKERRYGWIPTLLIMIPLIHLAGTREDMGFDTSVYRYSFRNLPSSITELANYITDDTKDKGFTVISVIIKSIIGNRDIIYFTIISSICLFCVINNYRKYSCSFVISVFLFVASAEYLQWNYNGVRQFIPVAILFACTGLILEKKYTFLIVLILLLSTVHASALMMIPIIVTVQGEALNKKTLLCVIAVLIAITSLEQFTDVVTSVMENTQYKGEVELYLSTEGTNMLRVLVFSIPTLLSIVFLRRIRLIDNPLINLSVNMSVISSAMYLLSAFSSGIFIGRLPIYFSLYNYILLPWQVENIFTKKSGKIIYMIMIFLYMIFYYYQTYVVWEIVG